jgi:uncharacterized membrane protein
MVCLGCIFYQWLLQKVQKDALRVVTSLAMLVWCLFLPVHLYSISDFLIGEKSPPLSSTVFMIILFACVILSLVIGAFIFPAKKNDDPSAMAK